MPARCNHLSKVILCTLACVTFSVSALADSRGPIIPKGKGEQCVAETNFMRRNHMDLLNHQRDETVIKGIRTEPFSLVECVDCHVQRDANNVPIRIDAKDQFCASCHTFVAAKIDCFSCHAAVPDEDSSAHVNESLWNPNNRLLALARRAVSAQNIPAGQDHHESKTAQ